MEHVIYVYTDTISGARVSGSFELLADAVSFCEEEAHFGETCVIKEAYESLTGWENYLTIMSWTKGSAVEGCFTNNYGQVWGDSAYCGED